MLQAFPSVYESPQDSPIIFHEDTLCVLVYVHVYVCVHVRGGQRLTLGVVPWELSTMGFETSFLIVYT